MLRVIARTKGDRADESPLGLCTSAFGKSSLVPPHGPRCHLQFICIIRWCSSIICPTIMLMSF
jgi:hypothetical protein